MVSKTAELPVGLFAIHITFAEGPDSGGGKMGINREDEKGGKIEALMCFQLVGFGFFLIFFFFCRCSVLSHLDASFHLLAATGDWAAWFCSAGNNEQEITITKCVSSSPALISCRIFGSSEHSHLHKEKEVQNKNAPLPPLGQGELETGDSERVGNSQACSPWDVPYLAQFLELPVFPG